MAGSTNWKGMKKIVSIIDRALSCYPVSKEIYDFDTINYMCPTGMIPLKFRRKKWIVDRVCNDKKDKKKGWI